MDLTINDLELIRLALRNYRTELEIAKIRLEMEQLRSGIGMTEEYDRQITKVQSLHNDVCVMLARRKDPDEAC